MIFKTFDSDIDNMSSRWGMFGKSFSDIGDTITTKWKQVTDYVAVTNDATIPGMMSAWKGTSPVQFLSDDSVVNVLNDYNKALDKGAEATAKFFETGTGNDFMNGWLKQLKGAPATMDDYKAAVTKAELAQNGLTASMVASKVAALALNVAVSMGISIAIPTFGKGGICMVRCKASGLPMITYWDKDYYADHGTIDVGDLSQQVEQCNTDIETLKKSVSDGKDLLADAITEKGIQTASDNTFELMAEKIKQIQSVGYGVYGKADMTIASNGTVRYIWNMYDRTGG